MNRVFEQIKIVLLDHFLWFGDEESDFYIQFIHHIFLLQFYYRPNWQSKKSVIGALFQNTGVILQKYDQLLSQQPLQSYTLAQ